MIVFTDALTLCQNITSDNSTSSQTFFTQMMNTGYKDLLSKLGRSITEKTKTASTVANQQYYQTPPEFKWIKDLTIKVGTTIYPIAEIVTQEEWDLLNVQTQYSDVPMFFFVRTNFGVGGTEFGIYPIPASNGNTITMVFESSGRDMSQTDYTTGTISLTQGSPTLTGSGTAFSTSMVNRYFQVNDPTGDGLWYLISSRTSNTVLTLGQNYEGASVSGVNYRISECFALPEDLHILPVYYALGHYYLMQEDSKTAVLYMGDGTTEDRSLYTSGVRAAKKAYGANSRSNRVGNKPWTGQVSGADSPLPFYFPSIIH
jgi:hypothetical protein